MPLIVQKFGGTSVSDIERIRNVAERVKETRDKGNQVVVVVSARAGVTDRLIAEAKRLSSEPDEREMDVLLSVGEQESIALLTIALQSIGVPAISRTGRQAGVETDSNHTRARITRVTGGDVLQQTKQGKVVIVAGFQGLGCDGEITTFGRGASDLTAIAISASLDAEICEIFTDVDGVFTADPRVVPKARKLLEISYDEMLEMASLGSKVVQARAVELAKKFSVDFEVRSTFNKNRGTIVKEEVASMEDVLVRGAAIDVNQVKIVVNEVPDQPGTAAKIFQQLADAQIVVDMIVQNIGRGGKANLTFTVPSDDAYRAEKSVQECLIEMGGGKISSVNGIAKLSVVGVGMRTHTGVAASLFSALATAGINIQIISTSEIKISVAIEPEHSDEALRIAHNAFGLGS
ncbi:MAG: Aspartate kinase Ask_LysC [Candidatus Moanabacter tarae]|uniref:Aspartokinase n=1 Tax=Candidatus Moanibacter tarae TaxID=2200854 RepID=A0A2Z4AF80_9BACT|nr:MAG: Aspartate kinase Ask_LysC [Candidatus Moanabacter tarae]|tara:strand:- start:3269 stop:4483 length:1215 start_codon:yes stop_codon:yes gene_type:complete